ncbi:uncharacterized protein DNG_09525 [Cephalotrichum gorgonifer]|uniref:Rhodopsin domain-containing protein n=1 Tax=Cephalotrichum gorgonifer TaxID=2041049 RepID=A0AAE8N5W1_9PEZI|nr:uncharacterized protein DNG_09525 [Cephalotrichum gorgonifer]
MSNATLPSPPPLSHRAIELIIEISTITAVALIFVVARISSRLISVGKLGIGDLLVIFSIILGILFVALAGVGIHYGGAQHAADLHPQDLSRSIRFTLISFAPGAMSFTFPKYAVVLLLVKILNPGKNHRRFMWVVSVVYGLLVVSAVVINFAQCQPPAKQWGGATGKCWSRQIIVVYGTVLAALSALFDFYLAIYSTIILWRLQMSWKKKLGLSFALGFGYW